MIKRLNGILICIAIVLPVMLGLSCSITGKKQFKHTFFRMDTITEITINCGPAIHPDKIWKDTDSLMKDWEERFSITNPRSEILKLNNRKSDTVTVSLQLAEILAGAIQMAKLTNGNFDFTILPIKELWGFGEQSSGDSPLPSPAQVTETLKKVDYRRIKLDSVGNKVYFASPDIKVDVGGIAKEFVMRELGKLLDHYGLTDYLISAGGDIYAKGGRLDGKKWVIGIQHPRNKDEVLAVLDLDRSTILTSGDYERYRIIDGVRYCHIFNPHTGYSCNKNQSLTIGADGPLDILSVGLFGLDEKDILAYVNAHPRLQCVIVDSEGKIFVSNGWKGKIRLQ